MNLFPEGIFKGLVHMSLDSIIAPEISNDAFHEAIFSLASSQPLRHILEIGSSSGQGSTDAWVQGISRNPGRPTLHCLELSKPRFNKLRDHYADNSQVRCYWGSSVGLHQFPSEAEVTAFYESVPSKLREYPLPQVLSWLREDIDYVRRHEAPSDGIAQALRSCGQNTFDAVLIDGSEFTGVPEFARIYGAKFILLDDILTYKNWDVFHYLAEDPMYQAIMARGDIRNGFAIFRRNS
ncbi:MAG: hypothetical protein RL326_1282 [Pseudomonadota bacterium]|jgi:hypothetical protein